MTVGKRLWLALIGSFLAVLVATAPASAQAKNPTSSSSWAMTSACGISAPTIAV